MLSSTSSFDRAVPAQRWGRMCGIVALMTVLLVAGWEILCRQRGFAPALDDTPDLWAQTRERLDDAPADQIVLIGSSRILFDLDIDTFHRLAGGTRPIQLATVGTNELHLLEVLAKDPGFRGTAIVSFVPGLTFLPARAATRIVRKAIETYEHGALSQRIGARLWQWLDARLAFLNTEELSLRKLIEQLDLPQRAGVEGAALFLPYIYFVDDERRGYLFDGVETDLARQQQVKAAWMFADPKPEKPEVAAAEREALRHEILWRARAAVTAIRARGGRVIYVRFPSTGGVLAQEDVDFPRDRTWDALLAITGAPGIHFQDHPELARFDCPEWSHLSARDAVDFTRALVPLIAPHLR